MDFVTDYHGPPRKHDATGLLIERLTNVHISSSLSLKDYPVRNWQEMFQQEIVSSLTKCRAPICWDQVGERILEGPEMIEVTNEKVAVAREKLKEAQTRQKSYADKHRRALDSSRWKHVFLQDITTPRVRRFERANSLILTVMTSHEEQDDPFCQNPLEESSRAGSYLGDRGVYTDFLSSFPSMIWYLEGYWACEECVLRK
ncbi:hypothetical protein Tco_0323435 [Tanacetum coccineum]